MEDELDAISRGERDHLDYLTAFYFGNGTPGLKQLLENKVERDRRPRRQPHLARHAARAASRSIVRVGRYGRSSSKANAGAAARRNAARRTDARRGAGDARQGRAGRRAAGHLPRHAASRCIVKVGRFGPYVQRGTPDDDEKPQNASLLKGMKPEDVDLATALKLLSLPRTLGDHPQLSQPVVAHNGRFGPYVKCGEETRSLPADVSPLDVTLEQARALLAQPKTHGRGRGAAKQEPLKVFDASPVTEQPVQLLDGRYGPYVTDGETNASLPKGTSVEELTLPGSARSTRRPRGTRPAKEESLSKKAAAAAHG